MRIVSLNVRLKTLEVFQVGIYVLSDNAILSSTVKSGFILSFLHFFEMSVLAQTDKYYKT